MSLHSVCRSSPLILPLCLYVSLRNGLFSWGFQASILYAFIICLCAYHWFKLLCSSVTSIDGHIFSWALFPVLLTGSVHRGSLDSVWCQVNSLVFASLFSSVLFQEACGKCIQRYSTMKPHSRNMCSLYVVFWKWSYRFFSIRAKVVFKKIYVGWNCINLN